MIRLVPSEPPKSLGVDEAKKGANNAYTIARATQRKLCSSMPLLQMLYRPGPVSYARLRGEWREAQEQVKRAQAVVDALREALDSLEATLP